jgi:hypothetical protein
LIDAFAGGLACAHASVAAPRKTDKHIAVFFISTYILLEQRAADAVFNVDEPEYRRPVLVVQADSFNRSRIQTHRLTAPSGRGSAWAI